MKHTLLFITILLISVNGFGQDVIYKKDNTKIECKILKVTDTQIEYNEKGLSDILMVTSTDKVQQIKFSNGTVKNFSSNNSSGQPYAREETKKKKLTVRLTDNRDVNIHTVRPKGLTKVQVVDSGIGGKDSFFKYFSQSAKEILPSVGYSNFGDEDSDYCLTVSLNMLIFNVIQGFTNKMYMQSVIAVVLTDDDGEILYSEGFRGESTLSMKDFKRLGKADSPQAYTFAIKDALNKVPSNWELKKYY